MLNFCTLFDSFYLTAGLTMYNSLVSSCDDFHLFIFAFDNKCFDMLSKMELAKATIIPLSDFEDEKLLQVKPGRTRAEYCWTCTPAVIAYSIEHYNLSGCTYLDADLYFYQNPAMLLNEMGNASILLTEHRYPARYNRSKSSGIYCVQFITFINNEAGMRALRWWAMSCLDWCFNRYEDGKFGDQKYLDDWTTRFPGVHVLQHLGGGLASWNVSQYKYVSREKNKILFIDKEKEIEFEAVFYHFHHVRFYKNNLVDLGWRHPTMPIVRHVYVPYLLALEKTEKMLKQYEPDYNIPVKDITLLDSSGWRNKIKYVIKVIFRYNVFNVEKLKAQSKLP